MKQWVILGILLILSLSWGVGDAFEEEYYSFPDEQIGDLKLNQHEDEKYLYYEVSVPQLKNQKLNVKAKDQSIIIEGSMSVQKEVKEEGLHQYYSSESSVYQSYPLPSYVDQNKMEMSKKGDKIILKFPKVQKGSGGQAAPHPISRPLVNYPTV